MTEEVKEEVKDDIFHRISIQDEMGVKTLLCADINLVNAVDDHGMTPLHHAAYKGNLPICQILLDFGADVNAGNHTNGYTVLHFAGLAGNSELCQLLLQSGAKPSVTNTVNRTAAQMAAFVGNHHCVATINSYVRFEDVEYFTKPDKNGKAKLDPVVARAFHQLLLQVNFHPVKITMLVEKNAMLRDRLPQLYKALDEMCQREMKKKADANELIAFKLHLLAFILRNLSTETKGEPEKFPNYYKKLLFVEKGMFYSGFVEDQLRRGVRDFPFRGTTVLQQLVANLHGVKVGEEPGAWGVISSILNGQKGFRDKDPCSACWEEMGTKRCGRCHYDAYCNQECQKLHWFVHKKYCKQRAKEYELRKSTTASEQEVAEDEDSRDVKGGAGDGYVSKYSDAKAETQGDETEGGDKSKSN